MSLSRVGVRVSKRTSGALGFLPALLISVALGACSTTTPLQAPEWLAGLAPDAVSALPTNPPPAVEIEEDGIEGQRPPPRRAASAEPEPDDPKEPFSPNYGSPNYGRDAVPAAQPAADGVNPPVTPPSRV